MSRPITTTALPALALGVALSALPGCATTADEPTGQTVSAVSGNCETDRPFWTCSAMGFSSHCGLVTGIGQWSDEDSACALAQIALESSHKGCGNVPAVTTMSTEVHSISKTMCKAQVQLNGSVLTATGTKLTNGTGFLIGPGVGVTPALGNATRIFLR